MFDARDKKVINDNLQHVSSFATALTIDDIESALTAAHIAADGHFTLATAQQWNTTFEFPREAIAADTALFHQCNNDFTTLCALKQSTLTGNRLSLQRVITTFGPTGLRYPTMLQSDFVILTDFARHGITPLYAPDFVPNSDHVPPLRDRYIKVKHTVNYLLYQQYLANTMIMLDTDLALTIPGLHLNPQHHADSKEKPEGRVIGDLSGQHDLAYTPLNGTSSSKVALRQQIAHFAERDTICALFVVPSFTASVSNGGYRANHRYHVYSGINPASVQHHD